jgi:hypothetical protein
MLSKNQKTVIVGLTVAVIFVVVGVLLFSYAMETLDVKAEELGAEEQPVYAPPLPDYTIPGFENEAGTILLGVASTTLVFIVGFVVAKLLNKKKS